MKHKQIQTALFLGLKCDVKWLCFWVRSTDADTHTLNEGNLVSRLHVSQTINPL